MKIRVNKIANKKSIPYFNTRCESGQVKFQEEMEHVNLDELFHDVSKINSDYCKLMNVWNDVLSKSFKKVRRSANNKKGMDCDIKQLMNEEVNIKKE